MILECSKEEILQIIAQKPDIEQNGMYYDWICYAFYTGITEYFPSHSKKPLEICADNSTQVWRKK